MENGLPLTHRNLYLLFLMTTFFSTNVAWSVVWSMYNPTNGSFAIPFVATWMIFALGSLCALGAADAWKSGDGYPSFPPPPLYSRITGAGQSKQTSKKT